MKRLRLCLTLVLVSFFIANFATAQTALKAMVIDNSGNVTVGPTPGQARFTITPNTLRATGRVMVTAKSAQLNGEMTGRNATKFTSEVRVGDRLRFIGNTPPEPATVTRIDNDYRLQTDRVFDRVWDGSFIIDTPLLQVDRSDGGAPALKIAPTGFVGIGTADPRAPLFVYGGGSPPLLVQGSPLNYAMIGLRPGGGSIDWQVQGTPDDFRIAYGQNNPQVSVTTNGTVRIKRMLIDDPYKETKPPNWHYLIWNPSTKEVYASQYFSSSRYKKDIEPLRNGADLLRVQPMRFRWRTNGDPDVGVIAEDVDAAGLKELVGYGDDGRPDSVNYPMMTVYLLDVARQQDAEIRKMRDEVAVLRQMVCDDHPSAAVCTRK